MKTKKITILTIIIVIIGLISVYSSSHIWALYKYDDALYYFKRQMIFAVLGFIAMFVTSRIDYHLYKKYYKFILIICFLLLIDVYKRQVNHRYHDKLSQCDHLPIIKPMLQTV